MRGQEERGGDVAAAAGVGDGAAAAGVLRELSVGERAADSGGGAGFVMEGRGLDGEHGGRLRLRKGLLFDMDGVLISSIGSV